MYCGKRGVVPYQKTEFWAKTGNLGLKQCSCHDRAKLSKGKCTFFSQKKISLLANFWWLLKRKTDFRPIFRISGKRKNGRFSIIPVRTGSVGSPYNFLGAPGIPDLGPKVGIVRNGHNPARRPKNGVPP